jgi:hypothetical protein
MRRLLPVLFLLVAASLPPTAFAQSAPLGCQAGQVPSYVAGFATLAGQLGSTMGTPTTCEYPDPAGTGDVEQNTTAGLAFWRKSTNTPTFTDGFHHWAHTPAGWVTWIGSSIDPPGVLPPEQPVTVQGTGTLSTRAFPLRGGTYTVTWTAQDSTPGDHVGCFHGARLGSADTGDVLYQDDLGSGLVPSDGSTGGETQLYQVPAGSYYVKADSGCLWTITIASQG